MKNERTIADYWEPIILVLAIFGLLASISAIAARGQEVGNTIAGDDIQASEYPPPDDDDYPPPDDDDYPPPGDDDDDDDREERREQIEEDEAAAQASGDEQIVRGTSLRAIRNFQRLTRKINRLQSGGGGLFADSASYRGRAEHAAPTIDYVEIALDYSYADIDDDQLGASGHEHTGDFFVGMQFNELVTFGLTTTLSDYDLSGRVNLDDDTANVNVMTNIRLLPGLQVGAFIDYMVVDRRITTSLGTRHELNESRWGMGLLAGYTHYLMDDRLALGLTTSVASLNKDDLGDIFEDYDNSWTTMADVTYRVSEPVSVTGYLGYYTAFGDGTRDDELDLDEVDGVRDDSYFIGGTELNWYITENWSARLGYEHPFGDDNYDEHRFLTGVSYVF